MVTQIYLASGYRGRPSQEHYIQPGTYPIDSPALFGAGAYLLENGFAVDANRVVAAPGIVYQDRDMSGRPIVLNLPQARGIIDPVVPIYEQPANRLDAADMAEFLRAQGYTISAPEPPPPDMPSTDEMIAYLQSQGFAVIAASPVAEIVPDDEPDDFSDLELGESAADSDKPLEAYTLPELKQLAKGLSLTLKSDDSKSVIIARIRAAQG